MWAIHQLLVTQAQAACDNSGAAFNLGDCLILENSKTISQTYTTPAVIVNLLVANLFVIAGVILFIMVIVAGFKFVQNDTKGKDDAKSIVTNALAGFVIMFTAYWIVAIVKTITGADILI